jgi:hypothetical protein
MLKEKGERGKRKRGKGKGEKEKTSNCLKT